MHTLVTRGTGQNRRLYKLTQATGAFLRDRPTAVIDKGDGWVVVQLRGQAVGLDLTVPREAWEGAITGPIEDGRYYHEIREWQAQPKQAEFLCRKEDEVLFGGAMGGGKMLDIHTPLPTPTGWVEMSNIKVGDTLFDEHGCPTRVTEVFAVDLAPESYRIIFEDGSHIDACADHLWQVYDHVTILKLQTAQRRGVKVVQNQDDIPNTILTTKEIRESIYADAGWGNDTPTINYRVAVTDALDLPDVELPLDPYIFGLWLLDAVEYSRHYRKESLTHVRQSIVDAGFTVFDFGVLTEASISGFQARLAKTGVDRKTHKIPTLYLRSSAKQRLALLQGLMDARGRFTGGKGYAWLTTWYKDLIDSVYELVVSLGYKATLEHKIQSGKNACSPLLYQIEFYPTNTVFRLPHLVKDQECFDPLVRDRFRGIISVEPIEPRPMRCIRVDSPSNLYLAGKAMIPTHNTDALIVYMILRAMAYPGSHHLYLRNKLRDLEKAGSFLDRSEALITGIGKFKPSKWEWTLPTTPNRSTIECGYCETEDDIGQYRTAQWETIVWDEVSLFTESQFIGISARARSTVEGCPSYVRAATNPGGQGHAWVKLRWIDPSPASKPFTIVPPSTISRGKSEAKKLDEYSGAAEWARLAEIQNQIGDRTAIFIPSKLWDNEILMKRDPKYVQLLNSMPEQQKRMFLYGDWDVFAGQAFASFRREIHVVDQFEVSKTWRQWIGYDFGLRDPACALWLAEDPEGNLWVYDEMYIKNCNAEGQAKIIAEISQGHPIIAMFSDPSCFSITPNGTSIHGQMQPFLGRNIRMVKANNDRLAGWQAVRKVLDWTAAKPTPRLKVMDNCINLIRTLPALTFDKHVNRLEDVNTKQEDHACDALRYVISGAGVKVPEGGSYDFQVVA